MKKTFSFLMIFLFPVALCAQSHGWEVDLGIAGVLSDVTLVQVTKDSLVMEVADRTKAIELSWVNRFERRDDPPRIPKFIIGGSIIGGLSGFVIGSLIDHGPEGKDENKKFTYGAIGGILGGSLGTIIGLSSGVTHHDVSRMTVEQKHALIDSIIINDSRAQLPPETDQIVQHEGTASSSVTKPDTNKPYQKFSFSVGPSFPIGDFAEDYGGAAKVGIAVTSELTVGRAPAWISSVYVSYNGLSDGVLGALPPGVNASYGSWWTIWPMTGIKASGLLSPKVTAYFQGQFGCVIAVSPEVKASDATTSVTIPSDGAVSIAIGLGSGIVVREQYFLSVRYLYGKPQFEIGPSGPGGSIMAHVEQSISLLMFTVGIGLALQ